MSLAIKRLLIDLLDLIKDPIPGVLLQFDEKDLYNIIFIFVGARDTPYDSGFFPFLFSFPSQYPADPPHVKFLNPSSNIRFHPNFYPEGKVCLSILNTWEDPGWTSVMSMRSLALSIQSIMNENPLQNEPDLQGFPGLLMKSRNYSTFIRFATFEYAIVDFLNYCEKYEKVKEYFKDHLSRYEKVVEQMSGTRQRKLSAFYGMVKTFHVEEKIKELKYLIDKEKAPSVER